MPSRARKDIVDADEVSVYHCTSRVVRRAFLCGEDPYTGQNFDHRKKWIEELLQYMAKHFALDILSFTVLSNHMHKQLRIRPDIVQRWTDREVARKWLFLYPKRKDKNGNACPPNDKEIRYITGDKKRVKELRQRLCSLSWFNRHLKEEIARRANGEDGVTGAILSGRPA